MKINIRKWSSGIGHCRKGFTIAEMLLVLIIIGLLMGIGGRTYYRERDRFLYNDSLTKILLLLRGARSSATSSNGVSVNGVMTVPPSGYGVYINLKPQADEPNFTLFASITPPDPSNPTLNMVFNKATDRVISTFKLPTQIHFQYLRFRRNGVWEDKWVKNGSDYEPTATEAVIFFRPPLADTYLAGGMPNTYTELQDISMRFYNPDAVQGTAKRCQSISLNGIQTFPVLTYSDCSESAYPLK